MQENMLAISSSQEALFLTSTKLDITTIFIRIEAAPR